MAAESPPRRRLGRIAPPEPSFAGDVAVRRPFTVHVGLTAAR